MVEPYMQMMTFLAVMVQFFPIPMKTRYFFSHQNKTYNSLGPTKLLSYNAQKLNFLTEYTKKKKNPIFIFYVALASDNSKSTMIKPITYIKLY
mgnify:CR=1 FL=1